MQTTPRDSPEDWMLRAIIAIANVDRLAILGILATRELTVEQLVSATSLESATIGEHLATLGSAGLIATRKVGHRRQVSLRVEALADLAAWSDAALKAVLADEEPPDDVPASVRQFFTGRRLASFPARQSRKVEVLSVLVREFEPGVEYSETEVNQILLARYPDFATLRRALIDEGLMTRKNGIYRRVN